MESLTKSLPWTRFLNGDSVSWLLEEQTPAVRHLALKWLFHRTEDDRDVRTARSAAMQTDPIAAILANQEPEGYWVKPGAGYAPKYRGTVWQVIFLDQLGADPSDARIRAACDYILTYTQSSSGGFGASGSIRPTGPGPSTALHCLHGNLLRAAIGFGFLDDPRVQHAIEWQARSIIGEGFEHYFKTGTTGPGFSCAINEAKPCAWGAVKALGALARIPTERRTPDVERAIEKGAEFLLQHDIAAADYPMGWENMKPSKHWFRLGFPIGYRADVLQNLEVLCELGFGADQRLTRALAWLVSLQDKDGRWKNQNAYNRTTWVDFEKQGTASKWVTLRTCRVLEMVERAGGGAALVKETQLQHA